MTTISVSLLGFFSTSQAFESQLQNELRKLEINNVVIASKETELDSKLKEKSVNYGMKEKIIRESEIENKWKAELEREITELKKTKDALVSESTVLKADEVKINEERRIAKIESDKQAEIDYKRKLEEEKALIAKSKAKQDKYRSVQIASRSGGVSVASIGQVKVDWDNLTRPTVLSAEQIDRGLAGTGMAGLGGAFKRAEATYGINALFFASLGLHESGNGNSAIARDKNNLFGYRAYDRDPYNSAQHFATKEEGIMVVAKNIKANYLTKGGSFHNGYSIQSMNVLYASDPGWAGKIIVRGNKFQ